LVDILRGAIAGKARGKAMAGADVSFLFLKVGTALTKPVMGLHVHDA
jgi:hypothetical protein